MLNGLKAVRQLKKTQIQEIVESAGFDLATTKKLVNALLERQKYLAQWGKDYRASLKKPKEDDRRRRHRAHEEPTKADFELFRAHFRNYEEQYGKNRRTDDLVRLGLTREEALAIVAYTNGSYGHLNNMMRSHKEKVWDNSPEILAYTRIAKKGIEKLSQKGYGRTGNLIRTLTVNSNDMSKFMERWGRVGNINDTYEFWSTSVQREFNSSSNIKMFLKVKNKYPYVDPFSVHQGEDEVLLPPAVRLKVVKIEQERNRWGDPRTHIYLEEVD
jgi:RNA binding exosome subunit